MESCTCSFENSRHHYLCQLTPKCQHCGCRMDNQNHIHTNSCPFLTACEYCGILNHCSDCPNYVNHTITQLLRNWAYPMQNDSMSFFLQNSQEEPSTNPLTIPGEFEIHGDCSICKNQIEQIDAVKPSRCVHCFHENCLMQWVNTDCANHDKCPECRVVIQEILKKN
jgi:hypothetical protein